MFSDAIPVGTRLSALLNLPKHLSAKYLLAAGADSTEGPYGTDPSKPT